MSISIPLQKKELEWAKRLAKGHAEWEDVPEEVKIGLYEAPVELTDTVPPEKIEEYEEQLAMKGYFGLSGIAEGAKSRFSRALGR